MSQGKKSCYDSAEISGRIMPKVCGPCVLTKCTDPAGCPDSVKTNGPTGSYLPIIQHLNLPNQEVVFNQQPAIFAVKDNFVTVNVEIDLVNNGGAFGLSDRFGLAISVPVSNIYIFDLISSSSSIFVTPNPNSASIFQAQSYVEQNSNRMFFNVRGRVGSSVNVLNGGTIRILASITYRYLLG